LSRDDFYTPTDIDALRMENELLAFEVRFLKAQLSAGEAKHKRSAAQLRSRLEESERRLKDSKRRLEELKHRLEESERRLKDSRRRLEESRRRLEESKRRLEESRRRLEESKHSAAQLRDRLAEAERAEQDLVLLLRRLASSPFGWFFGLRQNFRVLERRYLDNDA
jgi:septal ring factor EnvC (AmiA/AmiB activator)